MSTQFQTKEKSEVIQSSAPVHSGILQRKCGDCHKKRLMMQRNTANNSEAFSVPPVVHEVLNSPGQPLDTEIRTFMEPRFRHDFSKVRVHTDAKAAESARAVNALAYTVGHDVVFGASQYAMGTEAGKRTLAHELTHVVQQGGRRQYGAKTLVGHPNDAFEREADNVANEVIAGRTVSLGERANLPRIQGQGTLSCSLLTDPITNMPTCINMGGCAGTCVLHNNFPIPPYCTCQPTGGAPMPIPSIPTPSIPALPLPVPSTPTTPLPAAPAAPPPAPAPTPAVTDVTVANQAAAITYPEPSTIGAAGRKHFVTAAGSGPDVIVEATLTPAGAPPPGSVTWIGATPDPGNPARATVSRSRASKNEVTATGGGGSASLTIWAVFASTRRVNGPTLGFSPPNPAPAGSACIAGPGRLCVWATINNDAEIFPKEIITDPDRPNLAGARTVAPPGGTHPCGNPLAGGAPLRWDFSRQVNFAFGGIMAAACGGGAGFPADNAEGNDDSHAHDEMNDPYAGGAIPSNGRAVAAGFVGDYDAPSFSVSDATDGVPGDVATLVSHFREFIRLDYHRTWWLISNRPTWRVDFRLRKNAAGHWVNDGSAVA